MRTDEALAYLASLSPSTITLGLERMRAALETLGHPERSFPALHVAGTNGKGSTCALAASCLSQRYRVGFYSSPHLVKVNERFAVNGRAIDDETLGLRVTELLERLGRDHTLSYFEFGTLLALWHFQQERVDVAVLETGLGGRLDATTACQPLVTAITSISFDHMDLLGNTLPAIAIEKAGIVKAGIPLVVARQPPEVMAVFEDSARRNGSRLVIEGRDVTFTGGTFRGSSRVVGGLQLPLRGAHQSQNAAVALGCLELLAERGFPLSDDELRAGIAATRWPGRLEEVPGSPTLVLDGAHNPAGVEVLVDGLKRLYPSRPLHLVFGVFADKDSEPMMRRLFPLVTTVRLTPLHSPRSRDPQAYVSLARTLSPDVRVETSVSSALDAALQAAEEGQVVLVAGSLHLIGEALGHLQARFEAMIAGLSTFVPVDDVQETSRRLTALVSGARPGLDAERFRRAAFEVFERFPDAELGTPGTLVHELERLGRSEAALRASLQRQPTFLTVSMVNRVMNLVTDPVELAEWMAALQQVVDHALAADWVKKAARRYLEHQRAR